MDAETPLYDRIYELARQIPSGMVATYGQIADRVGCSARMVGYAMAALKNTERPGVPWQRVINRQGRISIHDPFGKAIQRQLLEEEGVVFDEHDRVNFHTYGWLGQP